MMSLPAAAPHHAAWCRHEPLSWRDPAGLYASRWEQQAPGYASPPPLMVDACDEHDEQVRQAGLDDVLLVSSPWSAAALGAPGGDTALLGTLSPAGWASSPWMPAPAAPLYPPPAQEQGFRPISPGCELLTPSVDTSDEDEGGGCAAAAADAAADATGGTTTTAAADIDAQGNDAAAAQAPPAKRWCGAQVGQMAGSASMARRRRRRGTGSARTAHKPYRVERAAVAAQRACQWRDGRLCITAALPTLAV